jgi:regulator of protease activity HflC (stomatin/prohibitin superfamily)
MILFIFLGVIGLFVVLACLVVTEQQTVKISQLFGKFHKVYNAGLSFKIPFFEGIVSTVDLRIQQLNVQVETKTSDNVFVSVMVAVQYFVDPIKSKEAYYMLDDVKKQFSSYVFDIIRSQVPTLTLDDSFAKKDDIANAIKKELSVTMSSYGFNIVTALVTNIDPDIKVKEAMNEINTAKRLQEASIARGEADKILVVKKAEAESESKRLQGEGIAKERLAIANGIKDSFDSMVASGVKPDEVMSILLLTQYFDTLSSIGGNGKVLFIDPSVNGVSNIKRDLLASLEASKDIDN